MSDSSASPPPQAVMMQMLNAMTVSRCISLAAELGIADQLKDGPKSVADLAAACGVKAPELYRMLRALAVFGVFAERPDGQFTTTPLSEVLRSDVPGSVRQIARWLGHPLRWRIMSNLEYSLRTGLPALKKDHPDKAPFEILASDPSAQSTFNAAMAEVSQADARAIAAAYDFTRFRRIVDVGGGHGSLAITIAQAAPAASVVVLDLPHVIEGTRERLRAAGLAERIETVGGSFMERVPGPADLCVLRFITHNWPDQVATRILRNCRDALSEGGRVLVCEMVITPGRESIPARIMDLEMMLGPGGRERTEDEFRELFKAAGFQLDRVIDTPTPLRLLEGSLAA